jgi:hypothetical protein
MGRAAMRVTMGLLLVLAVGLMLSPVLWPAGAQPLASPTPSLFSATTARVTTTTFPVTTVATIPATTSVIPTTPTTRTTVTRPRVTATTATTAATTTSTTTTTLPPIPAPAPAPVTLPLGTAPQSGNISAVFPILSGFGFVLLIGLLTAQWFLTKPGRRGPTL